MQPTNPGIDDQMTPPPPPGVNPEPQAPPPPPSPTPTAPPPPMQDQPLPPKTGGPASMGKIILSIVGVMVLVSGLGIGVVLSLQKQNINKPQAAVDDVCPGSAVCNIPGNSETFCKDGNVWTHDCLANSCWDPASEENAVTCEPGTSCLNDGPNQASCHATGGTGGHCGSDPVSWCATFECPNGDTDGDGTCNPTAHGSFAGDTGATWTTHSGSNCSAPANCGQVDYYRAGPEGQNWGAFCSFDSLNLTNCSTTTPTPFRTPTPPVGPTCVITLSPTVFNFVVGGAAQTLNAKVVPGSGATVSRVTFGTRSSVVGISPFIDSTDPYATQITPLTAGSAEVSALANVSNSAGVAGSCTATATVTVTTVTPTPTRTATPTPTPPTPQCQQILALRGGQTITPSAIRKGDSIVFRGSAGNAISKPVTELTFQLTKGGVAQTPVRIVPTFNTTTQNYTGDYAVTIDTATSYRVAVIGIAYSDSLIFGTPPPRTP